jgi:hypothetical protein
MTSLTPEEEREFGGDNMHPSRWHDKKHGTDGFCTKMKIHYSGLKCLDKLKWMLDNCDAPLTAEAMDAAASNGHLGNVISLHKNRFEGCTTAAMDRAASNGHIDVVKWLHKHRSEGCTTEAMDGAAANGCRWVVKWLHENRDEGCTTAAMDRAASNGHIDFV